MDKNSVAVLSFGVLILLIILISWWIYQQVQDETRTADTCKAIYQSVAINCSTMNRSDKCYWVFCSTPDGLNWYPTIVLVILAAVGLYLLLHFMPAEKQVIDND